MAKRLSTFNNGFALVEVMIALLIFSVFAVGLVLTQSSNISSSIRLAEDLNLHNLAELKMNEILISDIRFSNATENDPETGTFEIEGFEKYKFTVKYKRMLLPDLNAIMGQNDEQDPNNQNQAMQNMQRVVFDKMKRNIEEILWQVKVIVTNSETTEDYELNAWVKNKQAKLDTNFGL